MSSMAKLVSQKHVPNQSFVVNWQTDENVQRTLLSWGYNKPEDNIGPGNHSGAKHRGQNVDCQGSISNRQQSGWVDTGESSGDDAARHTESLQVNDCFGGGIGDDSGSKTREIDQLACQNCTGNSRGLHLRSS